MDAGGLPDQLRLVRPASDSSHRLIQEYLVPSQIDGSQCTKILQPKEAQMLIWMVSSLLGVRANNYPSRTKVANSKNRYKGCRDPEIPMSRRDNQK
jgi:hypothetical protein